MRDVESVDDFVVAVVAVNDVVAAEVAVVAVGAAVIVGAIAVVVIVVGVVVAANAFVVGDAAEDTLHSLIVFAGGQSRGPAAAWAPSPDST